MKSGVYYLHMKSFEDMIRARDNASGGYGPCGPWHGPAIGLMDLDAFFASVEALDHPAWRGRPIIVGGPASKRGVVSTCSYEARRYGVRSAMPSAQAERLCPDAIWTPPRMGRYQEVSAKIMAILVDETPYVEQVSVDEAFFDVTPGTYTRQDPVEACQKIMERISELGVTCSIGLSTSKTVSKIASEQSKPHGLTVVGPGREETFLSPLPVKAMSGIGARAETELHKRGVRTLGQLAQMSERALKPIFGANAGLVRARAMGAEVSPVRERDKRPDPKSISNERTFSQDLTCRYEIDQAISYLSETVGRRLRNEGLAGRTVTLKAKFSYNDQKSARRRLPYLTDDEHIFGEVAKELVDEIWKPGFPVRLLGVCVSDFSIDKGIQADLFSDVDESGRVSSRQRNVSVALDKLKERFGNDAIDYGRSSRFKR